MTKEIKYELPAPPLPYDYVVNVRVTKPQKECIDRMAKELRVSSSAMVRHFTMQAITQLEAGQLTNKVGEE